MSNDIHYRRYLTINLPSKQSAFLWGARKTGKSTYLKEHFPSAIYYDLLKSDLYLRFVKAPHLFREEILALPAKDLNNPIIIDEVQKIPQLLDEIHWLIENTRAQFILCGSSAHKLRQKGVNLLGGRALSYHFYPLVTAEITDFDLLKIFNCGAIPSHYTSSYAKKLLQAYVEDYLTQEIKAEGLIRNLPAFAKFLDSIGFANGEMINYTNIARECGIDSKTVKGYFQILIDTLLGYYVLPYKKQNKRIIISATPKFYLFDVGVANFLAKRNITVLHDVYAGKSLEQFILLELIAYKNLAERDYNITYWRTKTGLEVDFIIENYENHTLIAIESKISNNIKTLDVKGLLAFQEEHKVQALYIIAMEPRARKIIIANTEIMVLPVSEFLDKLWHHKIIVEQKQGIS